MFLSFFCLQISRPFQSLLLVPGAEHEVPSSFQEVGDLLISVYLHFLHQIRSWPANALDTSKRDLILLKFDALQGTLH